MAVPDDLSVDKPQHGRLHYLDNLKAILIILVILHHAGQPYGPGGWWFVQGSERTALLGPYFWFQASFFMGLMFFVSAYFVPRSFDRKGAASFLKDRARRLGLPLAFFFLAIIPAQTDLYYTKFRGGSLPFLAYYIQVYFGFGGKPSGWTGPTWPDMQFGHLWFVEDLLVYSVLYVLLRAIAPSTAGAETRREGTLPGDGYLVGYVLAMSAVSLLVRIWYPVDKWVGFLGFIQLEPAHLPQYLSMFLLGAVAYRRGWLDKIPLARGLYWLAIGFAAFLIGRLLPLRAWRGDGPAGIVRTFAEGFVAVGLSVGLVALFKTFLNRTGGVWQILSANAYAAYLFHVPVVIALQYAAVALPVGPLVKFAMVGLIGVPTAFGVSHLIRKLPLARSIL
jgi:peptidoglycan/LPS O-acetylase OafA/YrhL